VSVLLVEKAQSPLGSVQNQYLGSFFSRFGLDNWPPHAADVGDSQKGLLVNHWPITAAAHEIQTQQATSYSHDFYHRIHIRPALLALGNVVSTQSSDVYIWNAFFEAHTLVAIEGIEEGVSLEGQPPLPVLFNPLQERIWQVKVGTTGATALDASIKWVFDGALFTTLRITANRIIAWTFTPDWADGIIERLTWATDILQSETGVEQRRALRLAPRREFEGPMIVDGRERQFLDLALFAWSARIWALPIWPDVQLTITAIPAGVLTVPCQTTHLDFRAGGLAILRGESAFESETVEIDSVDATGLLLKRETQKSWPAGTRLYPVRSAQLVEQPTLTRLTDMSSSADVRFELVEPSDWPAVMPTRLYRDAPVYEVPPDETEDLTSSYQRLLLTLDSGSAMPLTTDTANRAFPVQQHRWLELGRSERSALRSLLYALAGRQKAVWLPTHADDLTMLGVTTEVSTTLEVVNVGYTRFAGSKPGRRDIRVEFLDGTVFHRRITASIEVDDNLERLALDSAFGRQVLPTDVRRISWLVMCRLDSDTVEIEHMTDSQGLAATQLTFRGVRDDEF